MTGYREVGVIVRHCDDLTPEHARKNPFIPRQAFFSNFAAGHLVGASIATHPFGVACGRHTHRGGAEMFFVLDGEGVVEVGDEMHEVKAGSLIVVPPGMEHNVIGTSDRPALRLFYVLAVAPGHEADPTPWLPVA